MRLLIFLFVFLVLSTKVVFASAPQIIATPSGTINLDQSFTLSATMSGLSKNALYRLRVALAQPDTTNYFGSTWNGTSWYNGIPSPINYAFFLSVTTDGTGSWFGDIQAKVDPDDPNFTTGSGTYDLKIGRYTQTGSTATWSNITSVTIFVPSPTPLPPTLTSTPAQTPYPMQKLPVSTPTVKKEPTITDAVTPEIQDDSFDSPDKSTDGADLDSMDILGTESADFFLSPTPIIVGHTHIIKKPPVLFLILGSIIVLAAGAFSGWVMYVRKNGRDIFNREQ